MGDVAVANIKFRWRLRNWVGGLALVASGVGRSQVAIQVAMLNLFSEKSANVELLIKRLER